MRLDDRIMKLDPGPMEKVNGVRYEIDGLVTAYRRLKPYTVQAMVVRGREWERLERGKCRGVAAAAGAGQSRCGSALFAGAPARR